MNKPHQITSRKEKLDDRSWMLEIVSDLKRLPASII
jgi:hypothetical protein